MSVLARGLAVMAVLVLVIGHCHRQSMLAHEAAAQAKAELAALEIAQAANHAAQTARDLARKANEAREREHVQALETICGNDLSDADYFRALDGLLHKAGPDPVPDAGSGPAGGLCAPAGQ